VVVLFSSNVYSEEASIDEVIIATNRNLKVSFEVRNAFTEKIEEAIASGIPTSFTFRVELYRKRGIWFNEDLVEFKFKHTVKHDNLREEYYITLEEKGQDVIKIKDFNEMKKLMTVVDSIPLLPMYRFKKGEKYEVKIKGELDTINMPFPLSYILFFVTFWSFETDWFIQGFAL
jgi:hypothetical protein